MNNFRISNKKLSKKEIVDALHRKVEGQHCCPKCTVVYLERLLDEPVPNYDEIYRIISLETNDPEVKKDFPLMWKIYKKMEDLIIERPDEFHSLLAVEFLKITFGEKG